MIGRQLGVSKLPASDAPQVWRREGTQLTNLYLHRLEIIFLIYSVYEARPSVNVSIMTPIVC